MADSADDNVDLPENSSDERRHNRKKPISSEISSRKKGKRINSTSSRDSSSSSSISDDDQQSKKRKKNHKKRRPKKGRRTKSPTPETSRFRTLNQKFNSSSYKTTTSKTTGTLTGIRSAIVNMQMKTTFFKEIASHSTRKITICSWGQLLNVQIAGRLKHFVKKGSFYQRVGVF